MTLDRRDSTSCAWPDDWQCKQVCHDFGMDDFHVRMLRTECTGLKQPRSIINCMDYTIVCGDDGAAVCEAQGAVLAKVRALNNMNLSILGQSTFDGAKVVATGNREQLHLQQLSRNGHALSVAEICKVDCTRPAVDFAIPDVWTGNIATAAPHSIHQATIKQCGNVFWQKAISFADPIQSVSWSNRWPKSELAVGHKHGCSIIDTRSRACAAYIENYSWPIWSKDDPDTVIMRTEDVLASVDLRMQKALWCIPVPNIHVVEWLYCCDNTLVLSDSSGQIQFVSASDGTNENRLSTNQLNAGFIKAIATSHKSPATVTCLGQTGVIFQIQQNSDGLDIEDVDYQQATLHGTFSKESIEQRLANLKASETKEPILPKYEDREIYITRPDTDEKGESIANSLSTISTIDERPHSNMAFDMQEFAERALATNRPSAIVKALLTCIEYLSRTDPQYNACDKMTLVIERLQEQLPTEYCPGIACLDALIDTLESENYANFACFEAFDKLHRLVEQRSNWKHRWFMATA